MGTLLHVAFISQRMLTCVYANFTTVCLLYLDIFAGIGLNDEMDN